MNILLTGSEGFIGSNLKPYLEENIDANIQCLDLQFGDDLQTCVLPYIQEETATQLQQPLEYAVVDKSKKKTRKGDKKQKVSIVEPYTYRVT